MARSRKHQPYRPITTAQSEKDDKTRAHREERRINKSILHATVDETQLKLTRELSNQWCMNKDGKLRFDPDTDPRSIRK